MTTEPSSGPIVEIQRLAPGGDGVGRLPNGEAVFVPVTAPGDQVEILSQKRIASVLTAERFRVCVAGKDPASPACPYADRCGGCDFMHLSHEAQSREKVSMLQDALVRIGGNPSRPEHIQFVPSESFLAYRTRLRLRVDKKGHVGFLAARSNQFVPIERCLVAAAALNDVISSLCQLDDDKRRKLSFCEQVELRVVPTEPKLAVRLYPRKGVKLRADVYAPLFSAGTLIAVENSAEDKELCQTLAVTDQVTLKLPVAAFSQVNPSVNHKLVAAVVEGATLRQLHSFVDAYAGAGNFALPLLAAGLKGESVDQGGPGILAARAVARDLGLPFEGFTIGDAKATLARFVKNKRRFDYVVLDPPRRGANKDVLELALRLKPRAIALIGCDPVALARDLGLLVTRGGVIESLTVFDMFPETHHSETLAVVDTSSFAD